MLKRFKVVLFESSSVFIDSYTMIPVPASLTVVLFIYPFCPCNNPNIYYFERNEFFYFTTPTAVTYWRNIWNFRISTTFRERVGTKVKIAYFT